MIANAANHAANRMRDGFSYSRIQCARVCNPLSGWKNSRTFTRRTTKFTHSPRFSSPTRHEPDGGQQTRPAFAVCKRQQVKRHTCSGQHQHPRPHGQAELSHALNDAYRTVARVTVVVNTIAPNATIQPAAEKSIRRQRQKRTEPTMPPVDQSTSRPVSRPPRAHANI